MSDKKFNINGPIALVIGVFILFLVFYLITNMVSLIWKLSLFLMPVFLLITFIIDRNILFNYGKWVVNLFRKNTTTGVVVALLSILGSPLVSLFLFSKAMLQRKAKKVQQEYKTKRDGEYIEYEEVEDTLELPRLNRREKPKVEIRTKPKDDSGYSNLFD